MTDYANPDALVTPTGSRSTSTTRRSRDRGRRGHERLREGPHPRRRRLELDDRPAHARSAATTPTRPGSPSLLSAAGVGADTTVVLYGGNNNWFAAYAYWLLKLRGFDARAAPERRAQEVGAREPRAHAGRPDVRGVRARVPGRRAARRSARSATRSSARSAPAPGSSTSVRPRSSAARSWRPTTSRRSRRRCPGTSPAPRTSRGRRPPTTTARSRAPTSCGRSTRPRASPRDQPVIAYCRIGERSVHTWFALQELLGYPDVKNYDGSWTEYGSLVGVPVELG